MLKLAQYQKYKVKIVRDNKAFPLQISKCASRDAFTKFI